MKNKYMTFSSRYSSALKRRFKVLPATKSKCRRITESVITDEQAPDDKGTDEIPRIEPFPSCTEDPSCVDAGVQTATPDAPSVNYVYVSGLYI